MDNETKPIYLTISQPRPLRQKVMALGLYGAQNARSKTTFAFSSFENL